MKKFIPIILIVTVVLHAVSEKVTIVSDRFEADEKMRVTKFLGHVRMKKGGDELNATRVIVYFDTQRKPIKYEAVGRTSFVIHMRENQKVYTGRADKLIYLPSTQIYRLYGNVVLQEPKMDRTITGERVVVEKLRGKATVDGGSHRPVKFIFEVQENSDEPKNR